MVAPPNLSLADSRPLDALFSVFVIAVVGLVGFLVLRYGRHTRKKPFGAALAIAITSLLPTPMIRFVIALTGNAAPRIIVGLVWVEFMLAFIATILLFLAPDRIYELGEPRLEQ